MYCKNCGKELSEEAIMCPNCGTPMGKISNARKVAHDASFVPFGVIALFLGCFSFVTGIIFGAFLYVYSAAVILLYFLGASTILPALTAICLGIVAVMRKTESRDFALGIVAIALAGFVLLFLFLTACILVGA